MSSSAVLPVKVPPIGRLILAVSSADHGCPFFHLLSLFCVMIFQLRPIRRSLCLVPLFCWLRSANSSVVHFLADLAAKSFAWWFNDFHHWRHQRASIDSN